MAALCGHFVALKHRMLRFLECSYITERMFTKEVSSYDTTDHFGGCLTEGHKPVNPSIMA